MIFYVNNDLMTLMPYCVFLFNFDGFVFNNAKRCSFDFMGMRILLYLNTILLSIKKQMFMYNLVVILGTYPKLKTVCC